MPDVVACEFMDEAALAPLRARYDVLYDPGLVGRPADLLAVMPEARGIILRNRTQLRGELLAAAKALRVVGRLGVGLDNIDLDACAARGIKVCPATGANEASVAEYVICTAMTLRRGAYLDSGRVASGAWPRDAFTGREMAGADLGLVGFGATAREVAWRARAFGMTVYAFDPAIAAGDSRWHEAGVTQKPLDALLANSDVVSLHVPLTPKTRHLIDAAALASMKPGAVIINAARGGVVDEAALVAALRDGSIGGAALDVFETEPLTAAAGALFDKVPNLVLTPHIAGVTQESNLRVSHVTVKNVLDVLEAA